ncbi:MAG: hypothetical protein A2169_01120, partial [Deltaproteobacteria bacterium RBG_13_47_9]
VKAKLNSAVDAAAIAGGRAVSGGDIAAREAAETFFNANFPAGYLRARVTSGPTTEIWQDEDNRWHIRVTASAEVPTYFLRIRGNNTFVASAVSEAVKRDLDMAFVVDNTTSMSSVAEQVRDASELFIRMFSKDSDRVALIKYAFGAEVPVPIRLVSRGFLKGNAVDPCNPDVNDIDATVCGEIENFDFGGGFGGSHYTNSAEGLWNAKNQLDNILPENRSSLRAIVFFTDGAPNTFASAFTFNYPGNPTQVGSIRSSDGTSGTIEGLYRHDLVHQELPFPYYRGTSIASYINPFPQSYNAHGTDEYTIWPSRRGVTSGSRTYANVNRISRNLLEDMANAAREEGIYVFTLGLGSLLTDPSGPDGEEGDHILVRMANTQQSTSDGWTNDTFNSGQPQGLYCHAATEAELGPCFNAIANMIFRLTR